MSKRKSESEESLSKRQRLSEYEILISVIEHIFLYCDVLVTALLSMTSMRLRLLIQNMSRLTPVQRQILDRLHAMKPDPKLRTNGDEISPEYVITSNTGQGKTMLMLIFAAQQYIAGNSVMILGPTSMLEEYPRRLNQLKEWGLVFKFNKVDTDECFDYRALDDRTNYIKRKDIVLVDDRKIADYPYAVKQLLNCHKRDYHPLVIYFRSGGYTSNEELITPLDPRLKLPKCGVHFAYTTSCIYCPHNSYTKCLGHEAIDRGRIGAIPNGSTMHFIEACCKKYNKVAIFVGITYLSTKHVSALIRWCQIKGIRCTDISSADAASALVNSFNNTIELPTCLIVAGEKCVTGLSILADCVIILENMCQYNLGLSGRHSPNIPGSNDYVSASLGRHLSGAAWIPGLASTTVYGPSNLHQIIGRVVRPTKTTPVEVFFISTGKHRAGAIADAFLHTTTSVKPKVVPYFSKFKAKKFIEQFTKKYLETPRLPETKVNSLAYQRELCREFITLDNRIGNEIIANHMKVKFIAEPSVYFNECFLLGLN